MKFLNSLTDWLRKRIPIEKNSQRPYAQLRLEHLEDRIVPADFATYTNASVQINPGLMVTETVTATVTDFPSISFNASGQLIITPVPAGSPQPTNGTVNFNLNNQQQTATLNANGQATVTYQIPLLAFLTSQTLQVKYEGFGGSNPPLPNSWGASTFLAPLYKNFDNVLLPSTLTFNQLTPQQVNAELISLEQSSFNNMGTPGAYSSATTLNPYNTANGETDTLGGGLVVFNYIDPGTINTLSAFGFQNIPGFFAFQLNAYGGFSPPSK